MKVNKLLLFGIILFIHSCNLRTQSTDMANSIDKNYSCDVESGLCKPTDSSIIEEISISKHEKVKLIYYTDPICSACWAIEPQLRKFKLEYGDYVDIEYKMGGLLPGWKGFADKANGISKPSDVASHWDEVAQHTGMSIDGDVWLEDPLDSSYPPSIAFKAAQKQGEKFALRFLRRIREQVFLEKKNITREHFLLRAIEECGGDTVQFIEDYKNKATEQSFREERRQSRDYGVRGFPTFIFVGKDGKGFKISGMSGYENYVLALEKAFGEQIKPKAIHYSEYELLKKYGYLSTVEISFALSQDETLTTANLYKLVASGKAVQEKQKFGNFWRYISK